MNGIQKVIKYGAIGLAIFIIVNIFSLVIFVASKVVDIDINYDEIINFKETYENVEKIKIDISSAKLNIKQGDVFRVEANDITKKFKSKLTNGTLKIEENKQLFFKTKSSEINIYIPEINLESIDIDAGAGSITIENVNTNEFDLDQGAGTITISNSKFLKADIDGGAGEFKIISSNLNNLDLDAGVGKIEIDAILTGENKIDCGVGEVDINLLGESSNYKIKINKGIGSIKINGENQSNDTTFSSGDNLIDIKGGIGNIDITTQK